MRALVLGFLTVATLTGCGQGEATGGGGPTNTDTQATTSTLDPGDICKGGVTAPFTVEELLAGMRAAGYDMYLDPGCYQRSASWGISNTSALVPELGPQAYAEARAREGAVGCAIFDSLEGTGATVRKTKQEDLDHTNLDVLNVSCDINPDPAKEMEQIDRLEQTLNQLAASQG